MNPNKEVLVLILGDLSTDYRCFKLASSIKKFGYHPIVLCDRPRQPLGHIWSKIEVRCLTEKSHFDGFLAAFLTFLWKVTPILLTTKSKIWIVEDGTPLLWTSLIGRLRGKNVVYDAREILLETPAIKNRLSRFWIWKIWLGIGERLAGNFLTVSDCFVDYYQKKYPTKSITLLPNVPLMKPVASPLIPTTTLPVKLLYQGALRVGSGLREVLFAISQKPEYELDIFGSGPERQFLENEASRLGISAKVRFHGAVPFEQLHEPMTKAHIGLHLLHPSCLSFDLTLSNKIFDYMHAGIPTLLSRTTAHKALLDIYSIGFMAASFTTEDILLALDSIQEKHHELRRNCWENQNRWSWEAFEPGLANTLDLIPVSKLQFPGSQ